MKPSGPLKHFVIAFVIALAVYAVFYSFIEHRRTRQGPWLVTFTNDAGTPALVINEPRLNLANCKITFPDESASPTNSTLVFAQPQPVPFDVPFGQCIFEDTTFQPGTVVFKMFGHEIQLLPRTLTIDRQEYAWQLDKTFPVNKANTSRGAP
ncbi:MAG: hypothetical protein JWQ04_1340 [Pedosphaera sp.]|nr:hypothetical protein [Pedosphaera sp.]